jgi:hypothetical protein
MSQLKSLLKTEAKAGAVENTGIDVLYDEASGLTTGSLSTDSWTLEEVYTTEVYDESEGEYVDEKIFVYVQSDSSSVESYQEDCEQDEHDGFLLKMADAAFDDIVAEAWSDAKETIVEKLLDQSKIYAHQEAYDFTAILCEGDECEETESTTTTTITSTVSSVEVVESEVESTVESVVSSVSSTVTSVVESVSVESVEVEVASVEG